MKLYKSILFSLALASTYACVEEPQISYEPQPGTEVQFGLSLGEGAKTRTIYGIEDGNAFPIYWVNNDKVLITSPQCLSSRNEATYNVEVANSGQYGGIGQEFADRLKHTGDAGVQWGDKAADFYSIYPASQYVKTVDESKTKFEMSISKEQSLVVVVEETDKDGKVTKATAYPNMDQCYMYAKKTNVTNGSPVELQYHPLSTAIRFYISGPDKLTNNLETINYRQSLTIQKITLTAPDGVYLAGDFTIDFDGVSAGDLPSVPKENIKNGSNKISLTPAYLDNSFLTLKNGESIEMNAFIIPQEGVVINEGWSVEIIFNDGTPTVRTNLKGSVTGNTAELSAGMIHRLSNLPALNISTGEVVDWNPGDWMVHIPRDVYASELSIPGSWNSINRDCQTISTTGENDVEKYTNTIKSQYSKGVRAFHFDTRWITTSSYGTVLDTNSNLGVACGGDGNTNGETGSKVMKNNSTLTVEQCLSTITSSMQKNENTGDYEEYMVVFFTFAQGSKTNAAKPWWDAVTAACSSNTFIYNGQNLTRETKVSELLGKVVVFCLFENEVPTANLGTMDSKCVFAQIPLILKAAQFPSTMPAGAVNQGYLYINNGDSVSSTGVDIISTQAHYCDYEGDGKVIEEARGYAPSMKQRFDVLNHHMGISKSYSQTENATYGTWIYSGIGGYLFKPGGLFGWGKVEDYDTVTSEMANWINGIVTAMDVPDEYGKKHYYPVGIQLMNEAEAKSTVLYNILQLNNKYRLISESNVNMGNNGGANGASAVQSAARGYSAGVKDNDTNAIGWE